MFRPQSSDRHQGSITVLVQLLLIGVHASSYSGMRPYVVCASVHMMYLSVWCLVMYITRHHMDRYITRHHTDRYIVCTDAQTTYSHIPEYDETRTPISSNCTSTVIDPDDGQKTVTETCWVLIFNYAFLMCGVLNENCDSS